jgi:hypothetical protein
MAPACLLMSDGEKVFARARVKRFFFEKKKQKTSGRCRGSFRKNARKKQKFFGSFFKKELFPS